MRKRAVVVIGLAALVIAAFFCTTQVDETQHAIVLRFGDPRRVVSEAGLLFHWPPPIDTVIKIDRRVHILEPGPAEYLTADKKNVLVSCFLAWNVSDPLRYLVAVTNDSGAAARLTDLLRSQIGTALGARELSVLVSNQGHGLTIDDVMQEVTRKTAERALPSFGVEVSTVRIRRLNFPSQNKDAVFSRMEAERKRIARQYRAEGEEQAAKIRATADREEAALLANANRQAEEIRGEADAEATKIYAAAFGQDPAFYQYLRSLETYEKIVKKDSTIILPNDSPLLEVMGNPDQFVHPDKSTGGPKVQ